MPATESGSTTGPMYAYGRLIGSCCPGKTRMKHVKTHFVPLYLSIYVAYVLLQMQTMVLA